MTSQPTIGLALGGGAARGIAHIVVLEAFDQLGIKPDFVAGCSIGALLGAAYASGMSAAEIRDHTLSVLGTPAKAARQLFWSGSNRSASRPINLSFSRPISLNGLGIVQLVSPPGMAKRVEDTLIPLAISTTDFYTATEVTIETGDLETAVAASIAIPGLFSAPKLNGKVLIDGAYTNPVPMDQVRRKGCGLLIAVDVTGTPRPQSRTSDPGPTELLLGATQILQKQITKLQSEFSKPDILISPNIDHFGAHDFLKIKEILKAAEPERERLKRRLERLLSGM
ncbi:patatin-like phospholipase family protein [uncultured Boseongicola sp.]|uniref:patatin-like phospholipase family protein n=1 Tax=uncultured Boseongicola sp. TaxID=1648499 RepID=UPI00260C779F|nr:patatin-like phospholipase family protein [uncultured Boseongicola sp.]